VLPLLVEVESLFVHHRPPPLQCLALGHSPLPLQRLALGHLRVPSVVHTALCSLPVHEFRFRVLHARLPLPFSILYAHPCPSFISVAVGMGSGGVDGYPALLCVRPQEPSDHMGRFHLVSPLRLRTHGRAYTTRNVVGKRSIPVPLWSQRRAHRPSREVSDVDSSVALLRMRSGALCQIDSARRTGYGYGEHACPYHMLCWSMYSVISQGNSRRQERHCHRVAAPWTCSVRSSNMNRWAWG